MKILRQDHLQPETLQVFADYNILVIKKEGDSSHINQGYDQFVAKKDKRVIEEAICKLKQGCRSLMMNQKIFLGIIIHALKDISPKVWEQSFIGVNLHPDHRIPFDDWVKKIDATLQGGERFFHDNKQSMFDAMPVLWKNMTVEVRHKVVCTIDCFYRDSPENPWEEANIQKLLEFVPLAEVSKLHTLYMVAKRDPSVFVPD